MGAAAPDAALSILDAASHFHDLTWAIREVLWIVDVQTAKTLYVSSAYEEIWGRPCAALYADPADKIKAIREEDQPVVRERMIEAQMAPSEMTYQITRPDGTVRWIRDRAFPIYDGAGKVVRIAGMAADFTQARAAHQESLRRQRLLASIVNSSDDAIFSETLDGTITTWNAAAQRIFGYTEGEIVGQTTAVLRLEDQQDEAAWILDRVRVGRRVQRFATRRRHKDGRLVEVSLSVSAVQDGEGRIIGASSIAHDTSEQKRLESKLSVVSEHLRLAMEATSECVLSVDADWKITYINRPVKGQEPEAMVGRSLWVCFPELVGTSREREYRRAIEEQTARSFEDFVSAQKVWYAGTAYPSGNGLLIFYKDVSEKHAVEEQLRSSQKMESIGQLAAGIAHEINTPIQYIGDNATFLKEAWAPVAALLASAQVLREEVSEGAPGAAADFDRCSQAADLEFMAAEIPLAINQALDGATRVAEIVKAMKEFSHPGSEEKRLVDLNRAIETTLTVARSEWKYVAEVITRLDPSLPMVPCLAGEINQVLLNLLVNAAHAIGDAVAGTELKGVITIATRLDADAVEISIADTGVGIPESARGRIFDPFFTTKEVGRGTGQGLTLAQTVIVKKHSGKLWFETEMGKGTTFFIRLPLVELRQDPPPP